MIDLAKTKLFDESDKKKTIGKSLAHESAELHVSGEALYVDDVKAPNGTLYAYVGISNVASGTIRKLDLLKVKDAEGVVATLTLADVPGESDIGPVYPGDPVMVNEGGTVEFHGQVLFAVAATSYKLARKAARLAVVEYEEDEPCLDVEKGLEANLLVRPSHQQSRGSSGKAINESPLSLAGELRIGGQEQMYLEGQASLCIPTENGGMKVITSNQNPTEAQKLIAKVLHVPMNMVDVEVRRMGGAFGGKETNANQWGCIAALLAAKTKRPVKIRLARRDDFIVTGKRHPFLVKYEVGFDSEGQINGLNMELSADCGMSADLSDSIVDRAMFHADNAYFLPAATIIGHRVKTNTVSNTAFRGFGGPQGVLAIENVVDEIARVVSRDPLDIRKLNLYSSNGGRDVTHYGQKIEQHLLRPIIERLEQTSGYRKRRVAISVFNQENRWLKKGLALTPVKFGISFTVKHLNQAGALIHVYTDGSIHLNHGGTEMGQGLFTKVAQVVAEVFGVDIALIRCSATGTDKVPNTSPTAASSGADLNGMAAKVAAEEIKARLIDFARDHFRISENEVVFAEGEVKFGERSLAFRDFINLAYMNRISLSSTGFYKTPNIFYDREQGIGSPFYYYANGAAVSEVILDVLTGEYRVTRVDICHDVGHSLNPALDTGQIEGGFVQGMGWLTTEELVWDDNGRLETNAPASYKIPAIGDTPPKFNVELFARSPNAKETVFRSKAVGEPPLILAVSTWCALKDAISSLSGYTRTPKLDSPATPERVLFACEQMNDAQEGVSPNALV